MKKYVITGGPCSGKTTTVNAFVKEGYFIVHESAREVIKELKQTCRELITWRGDVNERQTKIMGMQLKLEKEAEEKAKKENKNIIFIDRGIPDGIAFYKISNTKLPEKLLEESRPEKRKYCKIFFLKPIQYKTDGIRKEPPEIANRIAELTHHAYEELGYMIVNVPAMSVHERVKFIKENL